MKKFILGLTCGIILTAGTTVYASSSIQALLFPVKFEFNGIEKKMGAEYVALNYKNHTYVPVQFVADNLGAEVNYDSDKAKLTFKFGPNFFDGTKIKIGDSIAGMKVTRVDVSKDNEGVVQFTGKVTISGTYSYEEPNDFFGGFIFEADKESLSRIPHLLGDERDNWFVFENQEKADQVFGKEKSKGKATITIDQYFINYQAKEVYNTAILDKVIQTE